VSWQATAWAVSQKTGSPAAKAVLLLLANYADEHGSCFPSQERIAEETEQSVRSVRTHVGTLVDLGLVRVLAGGGINRATGGRWPNRYFLDLSANVAAIPPRNPPGLPANDLDVTGKSEGVTGNCLPTNRHLEPPSEEPPLKTSSPGGDGASDDDALFPAPKPTAAETRVASEAGMDAEFDAQFWPLYPRKVGKDRARLDYRRARRRGATVDEVVAGLRRFVAEKTSTEKRFIPHASTWLNAGRWADEPETATPTTSPGPRGYRDEDYWSNNE
jgi:hypothetical protein